MAGLAGQRVGGLGRWGGWPAQEALAFGGHGPAEGSQAVAEPQQEALSLGALTALALSLSFPTCRTETCPRESAGPGGPPAVLSVGGGRASSVARSQRGGRSERRSCAQNAAVCFSTLLCDTHTLPGLFSNGVLFASAEAL